MGFQSLNSAHAADLYQALYCAKARDDFWAYRRLMRPRDKVGWWQIEVAKHLQAFYADLVAGKRPIMLIQAPPQHGKSMQIVDFVAWAAGKNPDLRTIYSSFSERLGIRANLMLQRQYDSAKYKATFPDTQISERKAIAAAGQAVRNREIVEYVGRDGYFRNTTVRGAITGEGLDLAVIDDPIKGREEANSKTVRDKTWDWLTDDLMTRMSDDAGILGIMTRWHLDDPFGRLQDAMPGRVKVLRYPAIAEKDEEHRKAGEALFPELKSISFLEERRAGMATPSWESLYQQNPIIVGGGIFGADWWRIEPMAPRVLNRTIYVDGAEKQGQENDYSVLQCWGKTEHGQAILLDMIRGKWDAPTLLDRARAFWAKHKATTGQGALRAMKVEDKSSGTTVLQTLSREGIPVIGIPRGRGQSKIERAHDVTPMIKSRNVILLQDCPHLSDFLAEAEAFPNGAHDDTLDPMMDAVADLIGPGIGNRTQVTW